MKCDCEEMNGRIISVCALHGALTDKYRTVAASHPRAERAGEARALRDQVMLACIPGVLEKAGPSTPIDAVADRVADLVDSILRRHG